MSFAGWCNAFEAGFWIVIAVIVYLRSRRLVGGRWKVGVTAAVAFFWFGISDVLEIGSGVWWRPWPLLLLKLACVVVLAGCLAARKRVWGRDDARSPGGSAVNEVNE